MRRNDVGQSICIYHEILWYREFFAHLIVVFPIISDTVNLMSGLRNEVLAHGFRTIMRFSSVRAYGKKCLSRRPT